MAEKEIHYVVVEVTFRKPVTEKCATMTLDYALEKYYANEGVGKTLQNRRANAPNGPSMRITNVKTFSKCATYHRRAVKLNKNTWFGILAVAAGSAVGAWAAFLMGGE